MKQVFPIMRSTILRCAAISWLALASAACSDPEPAKLQYLESGNEYAAAGKVSEAILEYRNALRHDQRFGEARWRLAQALEKSHDTPSALREYVLAADLLPDNAEVQVKAGSYLLLTEQFEDAKARAERALKLEPQNVEALLLRANATVRLKDVAGAIGDIEQAVAAQPPDARMYASLGMLRSMGGQQAEAEAAFKQAIAVSPTSIEARMAMAQFQWAADRRDEAERTLNEARALAPSHPLLNRMLASFYIFSGRAQEAEKPLKIVAESGGALSKLALADYYTQFRRPDEAVAILKPLVEGGNPSGSAMLRLAQLERTAGRRDSARQMIDELLKREPQNAEALTVLSGWHLRDGDKEGALARARAAVQADPASAPAHFAVGEALADAKQFDEAVKALNEVLRLNPRMAAAQLLLSRLQLASGQIDTAVQLATDAKRTAPQNPDVRLALARSLIVKGNLAQAEPEVRALLASYPGDAASHSVNGMLLLAKRDPAAARAAFNRALEKDPNSTDALQGLLRLDATSGNVAAAVARIDERVAKNPKSAPLLFIAARTYAAARQPDRVEKALRAGLELDSSNLNAYMMLGQLYTSQKRLDEALGEFDAAAARQPDQVGAATMAATIVQMQGKDAEAQKRYEAIVARNQRAPVAANNLAWMYAERGGNLDVALQLAQSAKSQLPDVAEVNDTLGWIYYKKDLPQLAIGFLEQSASKDPTNPGYQLRLGLAYAKAGQGAKATTALQRAVQLNPSSEDAKAALATIKN